MSAQASLGPCERPIVSPPPLVCTIIGGHYNEFISLAGAHKHLISCELHYCAPGGPKMVALIMMWFTVCLFVRVCVPSLARSGERKVCNF